MKKILRSCAALVSLAACDGAEGVGGPEDDSGSLRFSHTAIAQLPAGTYQAQGEVVLSGTGQFALGNWAFAMQSPSASNGLRVMASRPSITGGGRHDLAVLDLPRDVEPGTTLTAELDCQRDGTDDECAVLRVSFRLTPQGDNPDYGCNLEGPVHIATRTARRISGTFSGEAFCNGPASNVEQTMQITGGTFDVPIASFTR